MSDIKVSDIVDQCINSAKIAHTAIDQTEIALHTALEFKRLYEREARDNRILWRIIWVQAVIIGFLAPHLWR